ncbi:hypothetical protein Enr10x_59880 [Gimesia panareensis]|uniref:Uncharacterized protein n=2 Tax=Gimesia panareensis TaxID=2527978 RepID=A0A517QG59_9PLAN|nr:hypothetical protein Enr10x_59880 [Gimesia panareensis]
MPQEPLQFAKLMLIFAVGLVAAALWHAIVVAEQMALNLFPALSVGLLTGFLVAVLCLLWKRPWWALGLGSVVSYLFTMGYVFFVNRIPLEWFYQ